MNQPRPAAINWRAVAVKAADITASVLFTAVALFLTACLADLLWAFVVWDQPRWPSLKTLRLTLVASAIFQAWRAARKRKAA